MSSLDSLLLLLPLLPPLTLNPKNQTFISLFISLLSISPQLSLEVWLLFSGRVSLLSPPQPIETSSSPNPPAVLFLPLPQKRYNENGPYSFHSLYIRMGRLLHRQYTLLKNGLDSEKNEAGNEKVELNLLLPFYAVHRHPPPSLHLLSNQRV